MKKFLSFALALVMVVGMVPAVFASYNGPTGSKYSLLKSVTPPRFDGLIGLTEWGMPMATYEPGDDYEADKIEYWWQYDDSYVHFAMRVTKPASSFQYAQATQTAGVGSSFGTHVVFRKGDIRASSTSYVGLIAMKDASNHLETTSYNADATADITNIAVKVSDTQVCYEFSYPKSKLAATAFTGNSFPVGLYYVEGGTATIANTFNLLPAVLNTQTASMPATYIVPEVAETAPAIDGTLDTVWGSPNFQLSNAITGGQRTYGFDPMRGDGKLIPEMDFYWQFDDSNLYVAVTVGKTIIDGDFGPSIFTPNKTVLEVMMGAKKISVTHPTIDNPVVNGVDAANFGYSYVSMDKDTESKADNYYVFTYEFKIPLSDVGATEIGDGFAGAVEYRTYPTYNTTGATLYEIHFRTTPTFRPMPNNTTYDGAKVSNYALGTRFDTYILGEDFTIVKDDETGVSTGPSATPNPNPAGSGLQPGLTPVVPSPVPVPNPAPSVSSFTDVKKSDWFYEDLEYVVEAGLMNGVGNNKFAPGNDLDRAMLVTTLWRLAGEPTVNVNTFDDVPRNAWYTDAVNWAAEDGIVKGYAGCFNPTDGITREQVVAILHRYADMMGYRSSDFSNRYYETSDWAAEDVAWADANGLLDIDTDMEDMTETANRAEIAALLANFCRTFVD